MLAITLSWPEPALWPNSRRHWSDKARAAREAKLEARLLTGNAMQGAENPAYWVAWRKGDKPIQLRITGHKPNTRKRDLDNFIAALKHQIDGIAQALGVDDSRFRYDVGWGDPAPPRGSVVIELAALP